MISRRNSFQYIVYMDRISQIYESQRILPVLTAWKSGRARASLRYNVNENTRSLSLAVSEDVFVTLTMSRRN